MDEHPVKIVVDCDSQKGELKHIWGGIGFDELNLSYMTRGKALFKKLSEFIELPYTVRNHNAFTSGNCLGSPARGSTNVYNEMPDGSILYDWSTVDMVYDTYVEAGCKPLIELGFMPRDLTTGQVDDSNWVYELGTQKYETHCLWRFPPKDYDRWVDLVYQFVAHLVHRYGEKEVETWYFELWNEPDIRNYWMGTLEEYCKLYDYSVAAALRALPTIKIGGPGSTCPAREKAGKFLEGFLNHCVRGKNWVNGDVGTRIDFISFHTKGAFFSPSRYYNLHLPIKKESSSSLLMMADIKAGMDIIARFPALTRLPVFIDECDIAVGTPYGVYDNPNYVIHNSEFYPNFVCALVKRILDLSENYGNTIDRMTAWAFYYDGKRYFEGNRTLIDNDDIEKPILNAFRLLSRVGHTRLDLQSSGSRNVFVSPESKIEVDGLAGIDENKITIVLWNQADEWWTEAEDRVIHLQIVNLPFGEKVSLRHYRIDREHSNAYREWERLGRPQHPTSAQINQIKERMGLELLEPDRELEVSSDRSIHLTITMPLFGTSLLEITPMTFSNW